MQEILVLYKEIGETPLACMERFRAENGEYYNVPMTYAGRLDPMAEGLLLVLAGRSVYDKEKYLHLQKVYECEILLGVETDTYDMLGLPSVGADVKLEEKFVKEKLAAFVGKYMQKYPPYSSKTLGGIQLHTLAKSGMVTEKDLPMHEVEISQIDFGKIEKISKKELQEKIFTKIAKVEGDFRQTEILKEWENFFVNAGSAFQVVSCTIFCSGGTYIRVLARELGAALGTSAALLSLKRIRVGEYSLADRYAKL